MELIEKFILLIFQKFKLEEINNIINLIIYLKYMN